MNPIKQLTIVFAAGIAITLGISSFSFAADEGHQHGAPTAPSPQVAEPEESEEPPTVEIPENLQKLIGVRTSPVEVRSLKKVITTVGRVEYDERRLATVNTKYEGWIETLHVNVTGMPVRKGEPLAEMYSPELVATQQEFINLVRWAGKGTPQNDGSLAGMLARDSQALVEAARERLRLWDISDKQIRKIEESGKPIRTLTIYSPANGFVVEKAAIQGMRVMPGEKLFDIADISSVWIVADIYESELPFLKTGQKAEITLTSLPGKTLRSSVDYIYPDLSGDTRTARVRFTVPNPGGQLKPKMFANVAIPIDLGKKLSIPDDAILDTGKRQIVYVDRGEGYFEPRIVSLGARSEGYREVLRGLKAGEKVASSATFLIDSEAQLKGIEPVESH